jgi:hypothetical protein
MRVSGSQEYGVLVRFFPCRVYIDLSHHDTLGYEWQLAITVISLFVWCTIDGFKEMDMYIVVIILSL